MDNSQADEVAGLIVSNAKYCGILQDISGANYIRIEDPKPGNAVTPSADEDSNEDEGEAADAGAGASGGLANPLEALSGLSSGGGSSSTSQPEEQAPSTKPNNKVFITHGKNQKILDQVKQIVAFGKFEPVIAKDRQTAAKSVPKKVMDDMRECAAAVIHVGSEGVLYDDQRNEIPQINGNVLIEIGAAMALYKDKFILLVEEGVKLPSNLQGLYECRYEGDELNMPATMKLLEAFNDFGETKSS